MNKVKKCACVDPNSILCYRIRYYIILEQYDTEEDRGCQCYCHDLQDWEPSEVWDE